MFILRLLFCDCGLHWWRGTTGKEYRSTGDNYVCRICGDRRKWK